MVLHQYGLVPVLLLFPKVEDAKGEAKAIGVFLLVTARVCGFQRSKHFQRRIL